MSKGGTLPPRRGGRVDRMGWCVMVTADAIRLVQQRGHGLQLGLDQNTDCTMRPIVMIAGDCVKVSIRQQFDIVSIVLAARASLHSTRTVRSRRTKQWFSPVYKAHRIAVGDNRRYCSCAFDMLQQISSTERGGHLCSPVSLHPVTRPDTHRFISQHGTQPRTYVASPAIFLSLLPIDLER